MNRAVERTVVLYDEDCGFCRWSVDRVLHWDRHGRIRATSIQSEEGQRLLAAVPTEARLRSMHVVESTGAVSSAGAAVPPVLRGLPFAAPLAWVAERAPGVTDRLYRLAADHRAWLGSIVGTAGCAVDPQQPRRSPAGSS